MAARLTDKQKKQIVADYLETESYRATGKKFGVCADTVKRYVMECDGFKQKSKQKKEQNTADILAYMEGQRDKVCHIIDIGLTVLPEKIKGAKSATEVTTALGTLIDKWTITETKNSDVEDLTPLAEMLSYGKDTDNTMGRIFR